MPLLTRRPRRPESPPTQEIRDRYVAFLPYVLPKITVVQPSLVPDGYNAGLVAAHSETLRAALNISTDRGRIDSVWRTLSPRARVDLSVELFVACVERARRQGYPTDDWPALARTDAVRLAPVDVVVPVEAASDDEVTAGR